MTDFEMKDLKKNEKRVRAENEELKNELEQARELISHLKMQGKTIKINIIINRYILVLF